MPEFSVTEEQLERLDALRAEIEAVFVDGYGHVRRRDALDYLLDTHAPPAEERVRAALDREVRDESGGIDYPALQSVARNTDGVKGSGMAAREMYEAVLEAKLRETDPGDPVGLGSGPPSGEANGAPDEATDRTEAETGNADAGAGPSPGEGGADEGSGTDPASAGDDGGSQLRAMMDLLETHEDRWRKAESGDAPYEVDLPDGGTEPARTRDDVKRILFTNY
ncbi:hypothetical protein ACFQE8_06795 [Salinirubellus sp. GCM10025818]|uniref:hypothetical protein n=1 Tax=Salinirubellus TaxID=2162630 RepID=UPI0030D5B4F0